MNFIKHKLYALFFWRTPIGEILNKFYDLKIHFKYSFKNKGNTDKEKLEAYLQKQFHVIEKGMALPNPRPGFGQEKIADIVVNAKQYLKKHGANTLTDSLVTTLKEYVAFNELNKVDLTTDFFKNLRSFIAANNATNDTGGTKKVTQDEIADAIAIDYSKFVKNRYSIRDFSDKDVPESHVNEAVSIAKYAPSVCNRQGWFAHLYTDKKKVKELLSLQNGNRGFTDSINKLIIITGDTKSFTKYESNQIFVDGGLFAMSLIFALHAKEIGSIALNTDIPYVVEKKMRKAGEIAEQERIIMMLGVGFLKDEFRVAKSQRKSNKKILTIHK